MIKKLTMFLLIAGLLTACGSKEESAEKAQEKVAIEEVQADQVAKPVDNGEVVVEESTTETIDPKTPATEEK